MPLNYRTATLNTIADFITEIKAEAESLGAVINYFNATLSSSVGGLHFSIPGSDRHVCFDYTGDIAHENVRYYYIGIVDGYNSGSPASLSAQPGYNSTGNSGWSHIYLDPEVLTVHIFSNADPFCIYAFAELADQRVLHFALSNLISTPNDPQTHTIKMGTNLRHAGSLMHYKSGNLRAIFTGGQPDAIYYADDGDQDNLRSFYAPKTIYNHVISADKIAGGVTLLHPYVIHVNRLDANTQLLGTMPFLYICNREGRAFGEEITLGTRRFKIFPDKTTPNRDGLALEIAGV